MKTKDLIEKIQAGQLLAVVEYRGTVKDSIPWRDEKTGRTITIKLATHNVEAGETALKITEKLDENTNMDTWSPPFRKGQKCVWHIETKSRLKGVEKASGKLEVLEP